MLRPSPEYTEWLDKLRLGERVALACYPIGARTHNFVVRVVTHRTKKTITVAAASNLNNATTVSNVDGEAKRRGWDSTPFIVPIDAEVQAGWRHAKLVYACMNTEWNKLPSAVLEQVVALVTAQAPASPTEPTAPS